MCRSVVLALLASTPILATSVFYSTDGSTTPGFTVGLFWQASSSPGGTVVSVEMQFMSGLSGSVDSIVAALSGSLSGVTFLLWSDAAGMAGITLDTFSFNNVTGTPQLLTATSTTHAQLTAGTLYWLEAVGPLPGLQTQTVNWYFASPAVNGTVEVENPIPAVLTNQSIAAFAVLGTQAPEPSLFWAVGVGLAGVLMRRRC